MSREPPGPARDVGTVGMESWRMTPELKQGYNSRLDDSMGARNGSKTQSMAARRNESKGMEKSMGKGAYSGATTMAAKGGRIKKSKGGSTRKK